MTALRLLLLCVLAGLSCERGTAYERAGAERLQYRGSFDWFTEMPVDGETCQHQQPRAETSGYVRITKLSELELELYQEALGCSVTLHSEDGNQFSASAAPCRWSDEVSLRDLGVVDRTLDYVAYDQAQGTLVIDGKWIRETSAGKRLLTCFTVDANLTLPP